MREARLQPQAILEEDEVLPPNLRSKIRFEGIRDFISNTVLFGVCLGYALDRKDLLEKNCGPEYHPIVTWLIV